MGGSFTRSGEADELIDAGTVARLNAILNQRREAGPSPSCLASKFSNRLAYLGAICLSAPATGIPFLQVRRWALGRLGDVILLSAVMQRLRRSAECAFDAGVPDASSLVEGYPPLMAVTMKTSAPCAKRVLRRARLPSTKTLMCRRMAGVESQRRSRIPGQRASKASISSSTLSTKSSTLRSAVGN